MASLGIGTTAVGSDLRPSAPADRVKGARRFAPRVLTDPCGPRDTVSGARRSGGRKTADRGDADATTSARPLRNLCRLSLRRHDLSARATARGLPRGAHRRGPCVSSRRHRRALRPKRTRALLQLRWCRMLPLSRPEAGTQLTRLLVLSSLRPLDRGLGGGPTLPDRDHGERVGSRNRRPSLIASSAARRPRPRASRPGSGYKGAPFLAALRYSRL